MSEITLKAQIEAREREETSKALEALLEKFGELFRRPGMESRARDGASPSYYWNGPKAEREADEGLPW